MCQAGVLKVLSTLCYFFHNSLTKPELLMMACRGEDIGLRLYGVQWGLGGGKQTHHQLCLPL